MRSGGQRTLTASLVLPSIAPTWMLLSVKVVIATWIPSGGTPTQLSIPQMEVK